MEIDSLSLFLSLYIGTTARMECELELELTLRRKKRGSEEKEGEGFELVSSCQLSLPLSLELA